MMGDISNNLTELEREIEFLTRIVQDRKRIQEQLIRMENAVQEMIQNLGGNATHSGVGVFESGSRSGFAGPMSGDSSRGTGGTTSSGTTLGEFRMNVHQDSGGTTSGSSPSSIASASTHPTTASGQSGSSGSTLATYHYNIPAGNITSGSNSSSNREGSQSFTGSSAPSSSRSPSQYGSSNGSRGQGNSQNVPPSGSSGFSYASGSTLNHVNYASQKAPTCGLRATSQNQSAPGSVPTGPNNTSNQAQSSPSSQASPSQSPNMIPYKSGRSTV